VWAFWCVLVIALFPSLAFAWDGEEDLKGDESLHVIVGPGARQLDPLAIPETRCVRAPARACSTVVQVLRRDMTLSFLFKVLPERSYLVDPQTEPFEIPSYEDWANIGARYVVASQVTGPEPYKAQFRLFSVAEQRALEVGQHSVSGLSERDLRGATHRFANSILEVLTGTAGVFDTRLAYSQKISPGVKGIGMVGMDGSAQGLTVSNQSINMLPAWGFGGVLYTSFLNGKPEIFFGGRRFSQDGGHYRKVAVSPDGSKVVASISYGGQSDLYLLGKDGRVIRNLTNSGADEVSPTFSPDGSMLAFVSSASGGPQIYVMNSSGGGMRRLTHSGGYNYSPDWGPGGLLAFAGIDGGVSDIFTVSESGQIERLTQNQGQNMDPSWSPDGRYIAFVSRRPAGTGLWLMSADGRYQIMIARAGGVGNVAWQR